MVQGVRASNRARSGRDGRALRRRTAGAYIARSAIVLALRRPRNRHGADWPTPVIGGSLSTASPSFPSVLCACRGNSLPLHARHRIRAATGERDDVIFAITRTSPAEFARRWAGMLALEFPRYLSRSVFPGLHRSRQSDYDRDDNRGSRQCHAIQTNNVVTTAVQKMIPSAVSAKSRCFGTRAIWPARNTSCSSIRQSRSA